MNSLNQAVYIPMPDGTYIAVDIWHPQGTKADDKYPLIIEFTRYWRIAENGKPQLEIPFFIQLFFPSRSKMKTFQNYIKFNLIYTFSS